MAESWFSLSHADQLEALEFVASRTGRPSHLLEKDVWVVWVLAAIYESSLRDKLTFKGGTSLSKAFRILDRFSEDVDLTYDIRELVPDLLMAGNPIPETTSQAHKITKAVRHRLPDWIERTVKPILEIALTQFRIEASIAQAGSEGDQLFIAYPALNTGTGYSASTVRLEFGARATGEPHQMENVFCDMANEIEDVVFPTARPLVMAVERTFWEKATAAHVYCLQGRLRGERYARHWYDLTAIAKTRYFATACADRGLAEIVARHKSVFFAEKDASGNKIDYFTAARGHLQLLPTGASLDALERDYSAMLDDGLIARNPPSFAEVIEQCRLIQNEVNRLA